MEAVYTQKRDIPVFRRENRISYSEVRTDVQVCTFTVVCLYNYKNMIPKATESALNVSVHSTSIFICMYVCLWVAPLRKGQHLGTGRALSQISSIFPTV